MGRLTAEAPLAFFDAAGDPLLLAPGNTWIELAVDPAPIECVPAGLTVTTGTRVRRGRLAPGESTLSP